ncbi:MAG: DUF3108 domain-containing protein [Acidobacteriia bacterium]|nr:DUF3108 domain-containing protein [Terriglobia bacterium]
MNHPIRNWSAAGIILLGLTATALLWHGRAPRRPLPGTTSAAAAPGASTGAPAEHPATKAKPAGEREAASLLPQSETLEFTAHVAKINNVASLRFVAGEQRMFLGRAAWHLQAFAHTQNPLRMVFVLDDQFDSYSDAATLASLQYELRLNERGQRVDSVLRMSTGKEAAPADATAARVLPGTRDPLGMLQYLRTVNWAKSPEARSPVFDGHKLYEVRARLAGSAEKVTVPAGEFTASKIELHVFENGTESKDTHLAVYLANTTARTPVLLEAVLPLGTARVELLRAQ